jgi:hypothetical protein
MNTIQQQWNDFSVDVIPEGMSTLQVQALRKAFYAGAGAALHVLARIGADDTMSDDASIAILDGLQDECLQYSGAVYPV